MTCVREGGAVTFQCDTCGGTLISLTADWPTAVNDLRAIGWTVNPFVEPQTHKCAECRFNPTRRKKEKNNAKD